MVMLSKLASRGTDHADRCLVKHMSRLTLESTEILANEQKGTVEVDCMGVAPLVEAHVCQGNGRDRPDAVADDKHLHRATVLDSSLFEERLDVRFRSHIGLKGNQTRLLVDSLGSRVVVRSHPTAKLLEAESRFPADSCIQKRLSMSIVTTSHL